MAVSRVNYFGETLINLENDTVTVNDLVEGVTAHDAGGNPIVGVAVRVDISQYYTKKEVDELIAKAIAETMGTNGDGYFWKSIKEG